MVAPSQRDDGNEDGGEAQGSTCVDGGSSAYPFFVWVVLRLVCNKFLSAAAQFALEEHLFQKMGL